MPELIYTTDAQICCNEAWEEAYRRYETPEQTRTKFLRRIRMFGGDKWPRDARLVELFCGSGDQLDALASLGFSNLEGADLSANLLGLYQGPAQCYVADCRDLPFDDGSKDVLMVDGGLHHLPSLEDLERVLAEACRVLEPNGFFCILEPWNTLLLRSVRFFSKRPIVRRLSNKLDAFETMLDHESETYERWLSTPQPILDRVLRYFEPSTFRTRLGHLIVIGSPIKAALEAGEPLATGSAHDTR